MHGTAKYYTDNDAEETPPRWTMPLITPLVAPPLTTQKALLVTLILTLMEEDEAEVRSAAQNVIKGSATYAADRC